ncbi:MAG: hypothetical protein OXU79_15765 [Gemmatimonadota bacterium]|nr:hypothetical protein [Gemmatimonadota bacterium]
MEERTFDLTVPVTRAFRGTQTALGVIFIILGLFNLENNTVLGAIQSLGGLLIVTLVCLAQRINKYIMVFKDENLQIEKGLFRRHIVPWTSITDIHIRLMNVELRLDSGKNTEINFSNISFNDNQIIKPQIIDAVTAFAEAKGIPIQDGRSG